MKKLTVPLVSLIAVASFAAGGPKAAAFERYSVNRDATNCRECHGDFRSSPYVSLKDGQSWGDDLHDVHRNTMLSGDCSACHSGGSRFPVLLNSSTGGTGLAPISCLGCHGRTQDNTGIGSAGAGLRQHHWRAGVTTCLDCHDDSNPSAFTPVSEDVLPPYYANPGTDHPNIPTSPCNLNGRENFAGSSAGLDNDGNSLYDAADCLYPSGDVNGDRHVTGADSLLINQVQVGLRDTNSPVFSKTGYHNGDLNQSGTVTGSDSLLINQVVVGLRPRVVSRIVPNTRTNIVLTLVAIHGTGFPTNVTPTVTIGPPVNLTLFNVFVASRELIQAYVPIGGGLGTGDVSVVAVPTNNAVTFGKFINR